MKTRALSLLLIVVLSTIQFLGPAALWAVEERGIRIDENRRVVIAAIEGASLTVQQGHETKAGQFRDEVKVGERLMTGDRTVADLLLGTRAVVTLGPGTTAQLLAVSDAQMTIQVSQGLVRVAAAPSRRGAQEVVTVQTPTGQVQTRGGIVRVLVEAPVDKAEPVPTGEAKSYRAVYAPARMAAVTSATGELIQVEEGTAEILGAGGKPVTLQAGQRVTLQAGQAGVIGEGNKPDSLRPGVVATQGHSQTPKEGREYLVALQVDQATKLGKALTGVAETTGKEELGKKSDTKNVINGATGGVTLQNNLVSALFGTGNAASSSAANVDLNRTGAGYGSNNNADFAENLALGAKTAVNDKNALLVFTRQDRLEPYVLKSGTDIDGNPLKPGDFCDPLCLLNYEDNNGVLHDVGFRSGGSSTSQLKVTKEIVLVGGDPNVGHGGIAPVEQLIVRGLLQDNQAIPPSDGSSFPQRFPPQQIVSANSRFVVQSIPTDVGGITEDDAEEVLLVGGTLGRFSNLPDPRGIVIRGQRGAADGQIDGAITATTDPNDPARRTITLTGGVSLDQQTTVAIGKTEATEKYFNPTFNPLIDPEKGKLRKEDARFNGSLLSVIKGPNHTPTVLTMQDRMLGVYDGSIIKTEGGDKALLSVLDAKLKGPFGSIPLIDIAAGTHFDRDGKATLEKNMPDVIVTSALVTRSTIPLDGALLEASAPLFALTQANMTTTSHFADLAGNQAQSLNLNGALVALNASTLSITSGHLLNLNNATAAISGYLFSLTNGSGLDIKNGALFSLNNGSSLTLTGSAFGVFGDGASSLRINNNLCSTGPCGDLVNSAGQDIKLDGATLRVAGVSQDVVLPNNFNVFAGNNAATVTVSENGALFHVDPTSTLTINGAQVR